jgi:hypothetical protein
MRIVLLGLREGDRQELVALTRASSVPAGLAPRGERQAIHRGSFGNVRELITAVKNFITGWNHRAHPFVWTKTADEILKEANRQNNFKTRATSSTLERSVKTCAVRSMRLRLE